MDRDGILQKLVSFVFQPTCCLCDQTVCQSVPGFDGELPPVVCQRCWDETREPQSGRCRVCDAVIRTSANPFGDRCRLCRQWNSPLEKIFSLGDYGGMLRRTIIEIKNECNDIKARQLGMLLGQLFARYDGDPAGYTVIPVPSHWRRRLSRGGFHVAGVISEGFCAVTGHRLGGRVLQCVRNTQKQSKLRPGQRIANVRGAFSVARGREVRGLRVVMVDDVMTSGATLGECGRILRARGASTVLAAVAARATGVR